MAWISVDTDVRDHPKTRHLSKLLQCSRHEAIGILVLLWQWGLTNATREGKISCATAEDIAIGVMFTSKPPQHLVDALITAGWLEQESDGDYVLHDWSEWQRLWYKAIDRRKANTQAQRECRARKSTQSSEVHENNEELLHSDFDLAKTDQITGTQNVDSTNPLDESEVVVGDNRGAKEKSRRSPVNYQQIVDLFHDLCPSFPEVRKISDSRKRAIATFLKKYSAEEMRLLFEKAEQSSFLKGINTNGWSATFDWLIKDSNAAKVIDGNYDDSKRSYSTPKPSQPDYSDTSRYTNIRME